MSETRVRAFVAVELPEGINGQLVRIQDELRAVMPKAVRWVRPEGIHLTLKFLGNVSPSLLPQIEEAMAEGCRGVGPFSLGLAGLGVFPNKNRARVLWIGVEGEVETLAKLQSGVEEALARLRFGKEARPFSPHLTLGRVEESTPSDLRRQVGELVSFRKVDRLGTFGVGSVSLMQSTLTPEGAIYGRLALIRL